MYRRNTRCSTRNVLKMPMHSFHYFPGLLTTEKQQKPMAGKKVHRRLKARLNGP